MRREYPLASDEEIQTKAQVDSVNTVEEILTRAAADLDAIGARGSDVIPAVADL